MIVKQGGITLLIENQSIRRRKLFAWAVHFFTATGVVWGLLAILAVQRHDYRMAFLWMGVTLFVDGFDGTLARLFGVKGVLPGFDGALLDNIIDFLTYVLIPALLVFEAGLVPDGWGVFTAAAMLLASSYQFCQSDAKTEDHFFKGFPSMWNVVVYYLFMLGANPWVSLGFLILCCVLVFVPTKYAYPSRMREFKRLTYLLSLIWAGTVIMTIWQYPHQSQAIIYVTLLYLVYYLAISFYTSSRSPLRRVK